MTRDDRIKLWRHKVTGALFEVRITDEYQTARPFQDTEDHFILPRGPYTDADHKLGADLVAHADEYEEVPMVEIDRNTLSDN